MERMKASSKADHLLAIWMSEEIISIELVVVSVNVNPIVDRLVVCRGNNFPGGNLLINCNGRLKTD